MGDGFRFFLWGLLGGCIVDGWEFVRIVRANRGKLPEGFWSFGYVAAELVRLLIGGALAMVFFLSKQIAEPLAAVTVGMTVPMIIERLRRQPPTASGAKRKSRD